MTIEEKAKAYDKALFKARSYYPNNPKTEEAKRKAEMLEDLFSELKESEDEKIRKAIIKHFRQGTTYTSFCGFSKEQVISYLEKQGEQKPVNETSEYLEGVARVQGYDDLTSFEKGFDRIAETYTRNKNKEGYNKSWYTKERAAEMLHWAKEELGLLGEQKPIEWSEEDEKMFQSVYGSIKYVYGNASKVTQWLESLRPQKRWKPSGFQLECLHDAVVKYQSEGYPATILESLYEQLKAIGEE